MNKYKVPMYTKGGVQVKHHIRTKKKKEHNLIISYYKKSHQLLIERSEILLRRSLILPFLFVLNLRAVLNEIMPHTVL